jgi:hypothetical protein
MAKSPKVIARYVRDVPVHVRSHPWGLLRPRVVRGYFPDKASGAHQKAFFDVLLKAGFKRTRWQLILPGQTAGLVKRVPKRADGTDQLHIRFYDNGTIDCEIEHHNFDLEHWSGARYTSIATLREILLAHRTQMSDMLASEIRKLFVEKAPYSPIKKRKALV